jgi:hypothetical protein
MTALTANYCNFPSPTFHRLTSHRFTINPPSSRPPAQDDCKQIEDLPALTAYCSTANPRPFSAPFSPHLTFGPRWSHEPQGPGTLTPLVFSPRKNKASIEIVSLDIASPVQYWFVQATNGSRPWSLPRQIHSKYGIFTVAEY